MSLSPFPTPTGPLLTDQNVISAANFGPITTIFTPPVDCTAALTMRESANLYFGYSAAGYFDPYCFPFGTKSRDAIVNTFGPNYYYSPAICPLDWTAVATFTSISSLFDNTGFVTIRPGTTAILCCPSGYKYARNGHLCGSTVTKGQEYIYVLPVNDGTIGLGVSIPLVITVALLLGIFLWRRRRYQAGRINTAQAYMPKSYAYVTQPLGAYTAPVEIYTVPAEAPSDFHGRHELPDRSK